MEPFDINIIHFGSTNLIFPNINFFSLSQNPIIARLDISRLNISPSQDGCKTNDLFRLSIGSRESIFFYLDPYHKKLW